MTEPITLHVVGLPETQGSKSAFVIKGTNRAVVREGGSSDKARRHKDWRLAVADAAREWQREHGAELLRGPVVVVLTFALLRPASAPKTRRTWPIGARSGDADKLTRSIFDSITGILVADDAQVVASAVVKDYGDPPGVVVKLWPVPDDAERISWQWLH